MALIVGSDGEAVESDNDAAKRAIDVTIVEVEFAQSSRRSRQSRINTWPWNTSCVEHRPASNFVV